MQPDVLLTIVGMALVTYGTRAGGLWLMNRVHPSPRLEAWLRQIPGAILVSIVAPLALTGGPADALATAATVLVAARTRNLFLTIIVSVGLVWALRGIR